MTILICILITASVLIYVFYAPARLPLAREKTRLNYLHERKEAVYENLRDLNFEYKAGKFPEGDYLAMKASLEEEAALILAEIARREQASGAIGVERK
jgi:hypothetical protein